MSKQVDSFRFQNFANRKIIEAWIAREPDREIPWTPLDKPLGECTIALVTTAGIAMADDTPFDQERERANPWWGDQTFRVIPRSATGKDIRTYHLHIAPGPIEQDMGCVLPLARMIDLEEAGEIGRLADSAYSFMGYILKPDVLLTETAPAMIEKMQSEEVDAVLLVPV
jgi:D-proline reductase (dithiol) PrdB